MKNVAIYCRVSSDDQKDRDTIENQVEILHTYVEVKGQFKIFKQYLDNGISGTIPFEQRPAGKHLIEDASKGLFNTVIVWKIDRFGRDTLSGLNAIEMLRNYNIEILSITEPFDLNTPTGRFQFITYLNMAELERNNILDRMFIGATRAAKMGKWLGGIVPFGYNVNKDGYLEISCEKMQCDYSEKEIIELIFNLYANDGLSALSLAVYLNNLNIPSSCGYGKGKRTKNITGKWTSGSIQRILNNTTYKGIHEYGKRGSRRKELIIRSVPSIVSEELWNKAQIIKKEKKSSSTRNMKKRQYLLRGLIECKLCGKKYYGISYKNRNSTYVCSSKRAEVKKISNFTCTNFNIKAELIEDYVWEGCLDILKNYQEYIHTANQKQSKNFDDSINNDLIKLKKSLFEKENEKNNILTLFRKNIITEKEVESQILDIKKEEDSLKCLIETLNLKLQNYKHEDLLVEETKSKLDMYNKKLYHLTFDDKVKIVNLLVKKVQVNPIETDILQDIEIDVIYNLVKLDICTDTDSY